MNAIFFEFTMVLSVWLLAAVVLDCISSLRRRWLARRAIERRITTHSTSKSAISTTTKAPANARANSRIGLSIIRNSTG